MERFVKFATLLAVFHFVLVGIHGTVHQIIPIPLSPLQYLFVILIITIAPITAVILVNKGSFYAGTILLFGSMLGSLLFGIYNHFIAISPDHISQIPDTNLGEIFKVTAFMLAVSEAFGVIISLWGLIMKPKLIKVQ